MGRGSYTSADWAKLKHSSKITETSTASQIFTSRAMQEAFDPRFIHMREARDSQDHPVTTPVMIGLDVTGSMGYLSEKIAKDGLHQTMTRILDTNPIEGPQLLFAAIGDVKDRAPLQVTQFESDIRIAEQLLKLWLEGCGGDMPEDYELLWYFAARHVDADNWNKRRRKGLLFTIGDADCHATLQSDHIRKIFDDQSPTLSSVQVAREAAERFELFHIHLCNSTDSRVPMLQEALNGHVIPLRKMDVDALPELITTVMHLVAGLDRQKALALCSDKARPIVAKAVEYLVIADQQGGIAF